MKGARSAQSRPYWIRYVVAFWAVEKLTWAKDNVLIACVCSLAPGLIAAGISAAISDQKWRAVTYASLLTYGGLFALFLMWRLVATPWELDRERQRFIDGLTQKLAYTRVELVAIRASPPAIDVEILEIHVQAADTTHSMHASDLPVACDIFLRLKLTLRDTRPIGLLAYELASVLHGNSSRADFVDDIQDWGLVTEKKPIGVGTTFHYTVVRLTKLAHQLEERGVPVEGWIHFSVTAVHEREICATIYRLIVLTPNGGINADIAGTKNLAGLAGSQFQKIPDASHVLHDSWTSLLPLIPNLSEKLFPRVDLRRSFHSLRRTAVNHAHHTAPLFGFCNDHFHWVGARAENRTHLGYVLHDVQQVYGIRITQDENEYMPAGQSLGVSNDGVPQFVIIALCPDQTWAG